MSGEALAEAQESVPANGWGHREDPEGAAHQQLTVRLLKHMWGLAAGERLDTADLSSSTFQMGTLPFLMLEKFIPHYRILFLFVLNAVGILF